MHRCIDTNKNSRSVTFSDLDHSIRRTSLSSASLDALQGHNEESYPHYHLVMSRHRPSGSHSDQLLQQQQKHRKGKGVTEGIRAMPTIQDVDDDVLASALPAAEDPELESEEAPEQFLSRRSVSPSTRTEESKEGSPEKMVSEQDHDADVEGEQQDQVTFFLGQPTDEELFEEKKRIMEYHPAHRVKKKKRRKTRKKSSRFSEDELKMRSSKGSELSSVQAAAAPPTDQEEAVMLESKDLEDISHHRFDHLQGLSRHKIRKASAHHLVTITGTAKAHENQKATLDSMYGEGIAPAAAVVDHSPHNLFVEMDELVDDQWVEQSRWIKYEEAREEGAERWGRPHVSSLSFHSLLNLRLSLEKGKVIFQACSSLMT